MRFQIEKQFIGRETQKELKLVPDQELILNDLEELLAEPANLLGEGRTAEVRIMRGNPQYCLKIIDDDRLENLYGVDRPRFNNEEIEFQLLYEAQKISGDVRVPRPLLTWRIKTETGRKIGIIVMERLQAIALKAIYEGASFPKNFDQEKFFASLREFLEKLHKEKHIHHRDIAEGNILIDEATGQPCLVDFGDAEKMLEEENPYVIRDDFGRTIRSYPNDMRALRNVEKRLKSAPQLTEVWK